MAGVKETKEVIELGIYVGKAVKDSLDNGKFDLADLVNVMTFLPTLGPAFDAIDQVPAEIKDLDAAEAQEIMDMVKAKLPEITDNARVQAIAAEALGTGLAVAKLVAAIRS